MFHTVRFTVHLALSTYCDSLPGNLIRWQQLTMLTRPLTMSLGAARPARDSRQLCKKWKTAAKDDKKTSKGLPKLDRATGEVAIADHVASQVL